MKFEELLSNIKSDHSTAKSIDALGGMTTEIVQSDKIGFDWENIYVGEVLVRQEYVQQENPTGTEDNPIVYTDGTPLINNAYYLKDGKIYVWMGEWVEWRERK